MLRSRWKEVSAAGNACHERHGGNQVREKVMRKWTFISIALILSLCCQALAQAPAKVADGRIQLKARPLPLNSVRLLGGPLKHSQDLDARQMLDLEPDRMMALLRQAAGLQPKAKPLGGWDGP